MRDRLGNEVPEHARAFAEYVAERGWNYLREWVPSWEDEEGWHEGFWAQDICQEKPAAWPREEGTWYFQISVSDAMLERTQAWEWFVDFADKASEEGRISCRVQFDFDAVGAFAGWPDVSRDGASG